MTCKKVNEFAGKLSGKLNINNFYNMICFFFLDYANNNCSH